MTEAVSKVLATSLQSIEESEPLQYWHAAAASAETLLEKIVVSFSDSEDTRKLRDGLRAVESYCKIRKDIGEMLERSVCKAEEEFDPWSIEIHEAVESRAVVDAVHAQARALPLAVKADPEDLGIVTIPHKSKEEERKERDHKILKLHKKGERPAFIADTVGTTRQTVYRVIRING